MRRASQRARAGLWLKTLRHVEILREKTIERRSLDGTLCGAHCALRNRREEGCAPRRRAAGQRACVAGARSGSLKTGRGLARPGAQGWEVAG